MTYPYPRLLILCLSVACGGGSGGGDPDADPDVDARPYPSCDAPELSIAWSRTLGQVYVNHVAFDSDGSLLTASKPVEERWDCAGLVRFDGDGDEIWRHPYDPSPPPAENYAACPRWWNALAIAPNGAIVTIADDVTGEPPGATDVIVRKHGATGAASWTYYNENAPDGLEGADNARDVAVDADGFIVASGAVGSRSWVGRFAPNGQPDWIWAGSTSGEEAIDVEVAADGTAFVGIVTGPDAAAYRVARFDPTGTETTVAEPSAPASLAVTPDGGVLFLVRAETPRLRKIDASGQVLWEQELSVSATDTGCRHVDIESAARGTTIGRDGTIYVALSGSVDTSIDDFPSWDPYIVLVRLDPEGELLSRGIYAGHLYEMDELAVGPDGEIAMLFDDRLVVAAPLDGGP